MPTLHVVHRLTDGDDVDVTVTARQVWTFAAVWVGLILVPGILCLLGVAVLMGWHL